jgi:hypothetical protein
VWTYGFQFSRSKIAGLDGFSPLRNSVLFNRNSVLNSEQVNFLLGLFINQFNSVLVFLLLTYLIPSGVCSENKTKFND